MAKSILLQVGHHSFLGTLAREWLKADRWSVNHLGPRGYWYWGLALPGVHISWHRIYRSCFRLERF